MPRPDAARSLQPASSPAARTAASTTADRAAITLTAPPPSGGGAATLLSCRVTVITNALGGHRLLVAAPIKVPGRGSARKSHSDSTERGGTVLRCACCGLLA